ncbi:Similar to aph-1: Gamma-secretase subunit Aph-1 (Drosophila melanogaster) [Cotesia congregata]|uniref:Similar to aph-1: Gamma-secretase subunit Aph-1 (Drosophila melanogaster) n=1 Tax=Cotesia congregata TaxID=51543 RepID=A0A8J2HP43_COTCN|nr:Similar to aph-1: Gamma-secretase subunit Aph-1 (Drosophila melanogaster) [Cotesia congregata]
MFAITVSSEPIRIIILIASAFFWLISLLFSSILWYAVVPLQNYLAFVTTAHLANSRHVFAYVCGLGFGFMSGAFALVNVLADAVGPGTMGLKQGSEYFFIMSAATTLCFILLHTFWGVIFFSAVDEKKWTHIAWVVLSHLFVSCMTLINRYEAYTYSLLSSYTVLIITMGLAFKVAGGKIQNVPKCFTLIKRD